MKVNKEEKTRRLNTEEPVSVSLPEACRISFGAVETLVHATVGYLNSEVESTKSKISELKVRSK